MTLFRSALGLLVAGLLMAGPAAAATMPDPVPDLTVEDQAVKAVIDIYAGSPNYCVLRTMADMPPPTLTAEFRKKLIPGSFRGSPWKPSEAVSAEELASIELDYEAMVARPGLWARGRLADPRILPDGARFVDSVDIRACHGTLSAYAPVLSGVTIFVEADYACALCGQGGTYALRKRAGRWVIVAFSHFWSS